MALSCSPRLPAHFKQTGLASTNVHGNEDERFEATVYHEKESAEVSSEALIRNPSERAPQTDQPSTSLIADSIPVAWHRINSKRQQTLDVHGNYWWKTSGYALAILLGNAGYSYATRIRILDFFACCIAPRLGVVNEAGVKRWNSFMTDDHNPIELSWDWDTGYEPPKIRFSVEPVGGLAGTAKDPRNELVAGEFIKAVLKDLPATNMQWFQHIESFFSLGTKRHSPVGHQSQMFWAFDLDEKDITGKAYFFPEYRAHHTGKTNIQVISEAIEAAPFCKSEDLSALYTFQEFVREYAKEPLEMDMLAIDLVEPSQSRLKIYLRSRETSFESVRQIMTLGGRLTNSDMDMGLQGMRHLWDSIFDQQGVPENAPLPASNHRTAGVLYYVAFRLGSRAPKVKIYIPVRHYAQNDWQIMNAVTDFINPAPVGTNGNTQLNKRQHSLAFRQAMCNML